MMPIVACGRILNAIKYCTKVSKTVNRIVQHRLNRSGEINVTRSHQRRNFRQSFRNNFQAEVANGVISGVIVDRNGTDFSEKFGDSR